jgi:chorismate synthase
MSIQAIKAVEFGDGADLAGRRGSQAHDAIRMAGPVDHDELADGAGLLGGGYVRDTHHAGGIEGGISTGSPVIARVSMKPLATLNRPSLGTVDVVTKEATVSFKERTDVTAVPAMGVVAETMTALVLAAEALRKFGGDSVEEFRRNFYGYLASLGETPSAALPATDG